MNKNILYTIVTVVILIVIVVMVYPGGLGTSREEIKQQGATNAQQEIYTCPMHPSVVSDKPGACPVCGMALVKKAMQKESTEGEIAQLQQITLSSTQRVMANIATERAEHRMMGKEISAVGTVDIAEPMQAKVTARFRGRIEKLFINTTGANVKKGEPLLELYSPELHSAEQEFLLALRSQSDVADALYSTETQQRLVSAARDRLRLTYGLTESQISQIETSMKIEPTVTYYSPISGTVLSKSVQAGEYVDEGTLLYQLADLSKIWAYLDIYEKDVRFLALQQPVEITSETFPDNVFKGRITFIEPTLSAETRTVRIRTEFENKQGILKPQMWVKAHITLAEKRVLAIPSSAILSTGKRTIVWVETNENTFEPRDVVTGLQSGGYTEIISPDMEGERLVVTGGYLLESESQLQQPASSGSEGEHPHATEMTPTESNGSISILVKGGFTPEIIHVKKGKKLKLDFFRNEEAKCTEEVVFAELNIKKNLPAFKHTIIELTPTKAGEIPFSCGMDMLHGTIIVHE